MNKKLIALAVAGALAVPAAASAADVEVYGKARVSFGIVGNGATTAGQSDSEVSVTSHASRLGVKGSEDLGNGLTAVYQVESTVDLDNGGGTLADRNSFVGLAGDWGTGLLGRHDTPYKIATAKMDVFGDTYADYTGAGVDGTHDARADNVIAYISPDMGGFTFAGAYVTDFAGDDDLDGTDPEDHQTAYSLALMGSAGPIGGSIAMQSVDNVGGSAGDESFDAIKLGLSYSFADAGVVNFIYETTDTKTATDADNDQDNIYLSGSFNISDATSLRAAYGMRGEVGGVDDTDGTYFALGAFTSLSKSTEIYALYAAVDNESTNAAPSANLGGIATADGEGSAIVVGINVAFSSK